MAFVRTCVIIVALVLGWVAVRTQSTAHVVPTQSALLHVPVAYKAS